MQNRAKPSATAASDQRHSALDDLLLILLRSMQALKEAFMVVKTLLYSFTAVSILGCSACFAQSLNYGKVESTYKEQKPDGTADKASPKLYQNAVKGSHYKNVTIEMRKAGGDSTSAGKPFLATSPALTTQGTVGGSTGPTKPSLPTTSRQR
jgi:hypothetical protein